jgi:hypothetical protein
MRYIEAVNSFFHLRGCGYHYNHVDEVSWLQVPRMEMMTILLSVWDAMIRAYHDSNMPDSWIVRIFGYFVMTCVLWGTYL